MPNDDVVACEQALPATCAIYYYINVLLFLIEEKNTIQSRLRESLRLLWSYCGLRLFESWVVNSS